ncbi:MAG: hypothetical protein RH862_03725 [Leptospiraceae bacterium]
MNKTFRLLCVAATLALIAGISCSRYSTSPARSELFHLSMAGLQVIDGKPHMAFGGAFLVDASRFTVVNVTDPGNPVVLLDIREPIPRGRHTFTTDPLNQSQSAWLYDSGDSRLNFDVLVVAQDGRSTTLHQGTYFSSSAKSTLRLVIRD